jgi:MoaA/NifB/PqqE/SkfB family radical SAM enzyme
MSEYSTVKKINITPRLPLEGSLDITYRCNNNCLHCWLRIPPDSAEKQRELTLDEIKSIADQARSMGCRHWNISGGEPMLRPDFPEIFEYLTTKSAGYTLNTNGTLITPEIARLLKRKGTKMVALYGATKETYDRVTRHPGGFEMAMQGFRYLQEAGAGFIVQLIPMRANWHEWEQMQDLAKSLSRHWRVGAPWLYLSSCHDPESNAEIDQQRLDPRDVVELDKPDLSYEEAQAHEYEHTEGDDRLFASCIDVRRDFNVDPYGGMTFCSFLKDPAMRYDLRSGTFKEAWETFIPALADKVHGNAEYKKNCGDCEDRENCKWCPVYGWLEHGRFSAPVEHLCAIARENKKFKDDWQAHHRRYFRIAGITIRVESDLDFDAVKFKEEFASFEVPGPGDDNVTFRHHFEIPDLKGKNLGKELYRKPPWAISQKNGTWYYRGIEQDAADSELHRVAVFNSDYTHGTIYQRPDDEKYILKEGWSSLSLFPTDQIWLAHLLADRKAVLLHSAAVILNGQGLLFVGHSDAGKSTTMTMLKNAHLNCEILCDDRNVARRWDEGWRVHGTWSHGDVSDVSSASAPLRAILFLQHDKHNLIEPLVDRKQIWRHLLATLIKPMITAEWWRKELNVMKQLVDEASFYTMRFDKSGFIAMELIKLTNDAHLFAPVTRSAMVVS